MDEWGVDPGVRSLRISFVLNILSSSKDAWLDA